MSRIQDAYEQLAQRFEREHEPRQRDNLLVLAADAAQAAGRVLDAERLRRRLLELNPHHLLRPFTSFADALASPDIRDLLTDLRRQYPPDYVQKLLGPSVTPNGRPPAPAPAPAPLPATSPYEMLPTPLPPPRLSSVSCSSVLAQILFFVVLLLGVALAAHVFVRPLLE